MIDSLLHNIRLITLYNVCPSPGFPVCSCFDWVHPSISQWLGAHSHTYNLIQLCKIGSQTMRTVAFGFAVGVGVGAGGAFLYVQRSKLARRQPASLSDVRPEANRPEFLQPGDLHPALKYGAPVSDVLRVFSGFVSCFDLKTRNPRWVLEVLNKDNYNGDGDRKLSDFFEDPLLEERFRNKLSDFRGSGYDRGHLAPAANHKASQKSMDDTFTLANMSPQVIRRLGCSSACACARDKCLTCDGAIGDLKLQVQSPVRFEFFTNQSQEVVLTVRCCTAFQAM